MSGKDFYYLIYNCLSGEEVLRIVVFVLIVLLMESKNKKIKKFYSNHYPMKSFRRESRSCCCRGRW